jgi:hypothetical protein
LNELGIRVGVCHRRNGGQQLATGVVHLRAVGRTTPFGLSGSPELLSLSAIDVRFSRSVVLGPAARRGLIDFFWACSHNPA